MQEWKKDIQLNITKALHRYIMLLYTLNTLCVIENQYIID